MRNRKPIFYWLLIGVPAIILTGTAISSLVNIQHRVHRLRDSAMWGLSNEIALGVEKWVGQQHDYLEQVLSTVPENQLVDSLCEIRRTNPLVRNVFVWEKGKGIVFPGKDSRSAEDQSFFWRYQRTFPPEHDWMAHGEEETGRNVASRSGTRRWADADGLQFVVWRQVNEQYTVGVEVEMIALLSRISLLPLYGTITSEEGVTLVDSRGRLAQYGNVPEKEGGAIYVVPLRPSCPTWQVEVHSSLLNNLRSGWATIIVGGALIFLLIASLFAGGFLFARDAARERRDALQKTTFVANVSHELKTPLTNIRLYAELLADGHAKTPEAHQQYLGIIVTESERLTRLINNVLDFGRLEQQRRAFHLEAITLDEWLRSTAHALQGITDDAEMAVTVSCLPGLRVQVDRDALSQVFLNVIDNACKYAKAGKVIDIAAEPAAGGRAALSISDRGDGLESRHAQRIFQRFFRVDDSTTASVGGCGLGLSIARQLMQGMGGDIRWTPRDGGGSTFVLMMKTEDYV